MSIPFNKPYMTGKETEYIRQAVESGKISGNGVFTNKCQRFFEERYGFKKCILTTSCRNTRPWTRNTAARRSVNPTFRTPTDGLP